MHLTSQRPTASRDTIFERLDVRIAGLVHTWGARRSADHAFADALRVIAASTRTGMSLAQGLERVAQRGDDSVARACAVAAARIELGRAVEDEIDALADQLALPAAHLFAHVVRVQHRRGGDIGEPCQRLASLLHDRQRLDAEARAATAQARFSSRAVIAIPLLLGVVAVWRSPHQVGALLAPSTMLLAAPGLMLIGAGVVVVRSIAQRALQLDEFGSTRRRASVVRRLVQLIIGSGARSRQSLRIGAVTASVCVAALAASGCSPLLVTSSIVAVGCALVAPWRAPVREATRMRRVAESGIESLLEMSIALFAAGATAHDVATLAPARCVEPLRTHLAPAVHHVGLGRTIATAFGALPVVQSSPLLDGWLHALCTSAQLGARATDTLEHLLRDARALRREHLRSVAQTAAPRMQLALVLLVVPGIMYLMLLATLGGLVHTLRASGVL